MKVASLSGSAFLAANYRMIFLWYTSKKSQTLIICSFQPYIFQFNTKWILLPNLLLIISHPERRKITTTVKSLISPKIFISPLIEIQKELLRVHKTYFCINKIFHPEIKIDMLYRYEKQRDRHTSLNPLSVSFVASSSPAYIILVKNEILQ